MRFWIDIEDSSGIKQGEGPVITAQYFDHTSRLSKAGSVSFGMPGVDPRSALVIKKNVMRGKTIINQVEIELGTGLIDHIERKQDTDGSVLLDILGDDLLRELVNRHVGELLIDDGAGGPDDDGPSVIMALAPSGWSLDTTEGYANSYASIFHQYDGETVLEALTNLAQITGEHFRLGSGRTVIWMRRLRSSKLIHSGITGTFTLGEMVVGQTSVASGILREASGAYLYVEDVSGIFVVGEDIEGQTSHATVTTSNIYNPFQDIQAVQGIDPLAAENNTEVCIITSLKEIEDSYDAGIGRVYAIGSGNGNAKLTLEGVSITPPTGYTLGNDSKGYYLEHILTWSAYEIERRQSFKDAQDPDELYHQAYEYLSRAKDANKAYELGVTKLDQALIVGKLLRVTAQRWIEDPLTGDPYHALNVDTDLYILEATNKIEANGLRSASIVVATVDEFPPSSDAQAVIGLMQQNQQVATHAQPVDGLSVGAHNTTHQNGGSDEISVAGLSGELADSQPPKTHHASHETGGSDIVLIVRQSILTFSGVLGISSNPLRIYNKSGASQIISQIFICVGTAPVGDDIIIDIHKNGTTIFTNQAHRPVIIDGSNTGYTTTIDIGAWADGDYLTAHVDNIGSGTPGSDLVVHIIHS
jgi:hypothetical protein